MAIFEHLGTTPTGTIIKTEAKGTDGVRAVVAVVRTPLVNILERAFQTLWQTFFGVLAAAQVTDVSSAKKAILAAVAAVVASIGSIVKTAVLEGLRQRRAS